MVLDVVEWTLLPWLQHLWLVFGLLPKCEIPFLLMGVSCGDGLAKGFAFVPMVLKRGKLCRNGPGKGVA